MGCLTQPKLKASERGRERLIQGLHCHPETPPPDIGSSLQPGKLCKHEEKGRMQQVKGPGPEPYLNQKDVTAFNSSASS